MALLRDYLTLSNLVIAQQKFLLTFTVNQELIPRSNFLADISPVHIVFATQEEDHVIFFVFNCIAYLNSFRYGSPICSISTLALLRHAIRHSFSFALALSLLHSLHHSYDLFFTYYDK